MTSESSPEISIIIPVYNGEKYLARCLDSVLAQNFSDVEILCIDDGSTDGSLAILREYAARDSRIRVLEQENSGASTARNAGLDAAQGTWIAFVDSDDEILPGSWGALLEGAGDEDAICFSAEEVREENGRWTCIESGYFNVDYRGRRMLTDTDLPRLSMTVWDKLFRRANVEACALRFAENGYIRREGSTMDEAFHQKPGLAFDLIRILDPIHDFWTQHALLPQNKTIFERICFERLHFALDICLPWERPGIVYAMAERFHAWCFRPDNTFLRNMAGGRMSIRLGSFPGRNLSLLHLKPLQVLFYVGNIQGRKVLSRAHFYLTSSDLPFPYQCTKK